MTGYPFRNRQSGLTLVEVLVAAVLIMVVLVPAMEALRTGMLGNQVLRSTSGEHYAVLSRMEEMLAEPYGALTSAAAAAGSELTPSSYSDAAGPPDRRLVFIALYDATDADGDGNVLACPTPISMATEIRIPITPVSCGCASTSKARLRRSKALSRREPLT